MMDANGTWRTCPRTTWNASYPKRSAIAASLNNAADGDEYRAAMREGLHTFDMLRERYGIAPEYGLWSMVASDEESRPRR